MIIKNSKDLKAFFIKSCENLIIDYSSPHLNFKTKNGPYNDKESHLRKISHDLISFCCCFKLTRNKVYKDISYSIWEKAFVRLNFHEPIAMRFNDFKDKNNGLIGSAWLIESMKYFSDTFEQKKIREKVVNFINNNFIFKNYCWAYKDVESKLYVIDPTFNHQIWFCSVLSSFGKLYKNEINLFLNKYVNNLSTYRDGIIFHLSNINKADGKIEFLINKIFRPSYINIKYKKKLYKKSVAYHSFNIFAITRLIENSYQVDGKLIHNISRPYLSSFYLDNLNTLPSYSWGYNHPGIESLSFISFIMKNEDLAFRLLNHDLNFSNFFTDSLNVYANDQVLDQSRLYELYQYLDKVY